MYMYRAMRPRLTHDQALKPLKLLKRTFDRACSGTYRKLQPILLPMSLLILLEVQATLSALNLKGKFALKSPTLFFGGNCFVLLWKNS